MTVMGSAQLRVTSTSSGSVSETFDSTWISPAGMYTKSPGSAMISFSTPVRPKVNRARPEMM